MASSPSTSSNNKRNRNSADSAEESDEPTPHRSDGTSGGGGGGGGEGEPAADSHGLAMPSFSLPRPPPHRSMSPTSSDASSSDSSSEFEEEEKRGRSKKSKGSRSDDRRGHRGRSSGRTRGHREGKSAKRPRTGSNTTRSTGDPVLVPLSLKLRDDRWLWPEKHHSLLKAYHDHACPEEAATWVATKLHEPSTADLAQNLNTAAIPYITKPQAKALLVAAGKWPPLIASTAPPPAASSSSSSLLSSSSSSLSSSFPPLYPLGLPPVLGGPPLGGVPFVPPAVPADAAATAAAAADADRRQRRTERRLAKAKRAADRELRRRRRAQDHDAEDEQHRLRQRQYDDDERRARDRDRDRSRSHDRGRRRDDHHRARPPRSRSRSHEHKGGGGGGGGHVSSSSSTSSSSSSSSMVPNQTYRRSPSPIRPEGPLSGSYSRFLPRILSTRSIAHDATLNMPSTLTDRTKKMSAAFMFCDSSDFLAGERAADGIHIGTDGTHTIRNRRAPFNSSEDASFMFDCWSRTIRACWPKDPLLPDELTKYTLYISQLFKRLTPLGVYLVDHRWRSIACTYRCSVWPMLPEVAVAIAFIAALHSRDITRATGTGQQCALCAGPHAVSDCHTHVGIDLSGLLAASKSSVITGSSSLSSNRLSTGRTVSSGTANGIGSRGRGAPRPSQKPDSCDHFNSSRGCKYHDSKCNYTHKCGKCGTQGHASTTCKVKGK